MPDYEWTGTELPTFVTHLECSLTGERYPADQLHGLSKAGKPLLVRYDLDGIRRDLLALPGVVDVHDLHVWTLTSEMDVASAHVMIGPGTDAHGVLDQARVLLLEHEIAHATIQVEPDDHAGCAEINW